MSPSPDSASFPPWIDLPLDVTVDIFSRLGAIQLLIDVQNVCTTWQKVCEDPNTWKSIDMRLPYPLDSKTFRGICRDAVNRSQGRLAEIAIENKGTDKLLQYISQRSHHLRSLKLVSCYQITSPCLRESAKRFPELEELHLIFMDTVHADDIELIGLSCPMLKSFTFDDRGTRYLHYSGNEYALAISKSMRNLQHLRLLGNAMDNNGLKAILNGCPFLESLDIRRCFDVDFSGVLAVRCSKQVKHLRRPHEGIDDYEWVDILEKFDRSFDANLKNMILSN